MQPLPLNPTVQRAIEFQAIDLSGPNLILYYTGMIMIIGGCFLAGCLVAQYVMNWLTGKDL
jgi:hypothetical protein